jgi:hypothetical protein
MSHPSMRTPTHQGIDTRGTWREIGKDGHMSKIWVIVLVLCIMVASSVISLAQQSYRLPDIRSLKHLTTRKADRATDIPGKETSMDYYSGPSGQIITVYSFRGRDVVFTTHSNSDMQGTYRVFMDTTGDGLFQEISRAPWQLPPWVRR